jgi:hypothetical protein
MMNRRDTLKVISGFALSPLVPFSRFFERDLSNLVNGFCESPLSSKLGLDLMSPWESAGRTFATDGCACISVPRHRCATAGEPGNRPDMKEVFRRYWPTFEAWATRQWMPLPKPRLAANHGNYCLWCERYTSSCPGAFGGPRHARHGPICHGYSPSPSCPICHGHEDFNNIEVWDGVAMNAYYGWLVRRIPGARWMPGVNEMEYPILIRGDDGIQAMVMPCV